MCDAIEDPSITIVWFIRGIQINLKRELTLSRPYTVDEAYHEALQVEKRDKCSSFFYDPFQSVPKVSESSMSAPVAFSFQVSPRLVSPAGASYGTSYNMVSNVQCFSCRGRGHYAFKFPHWTLALEHESHEPLELEEEVVDLERSFEDLVDVENSLLHDAHLVLLGVFNQPVLSMNANIPPSFIPLLDVRKLL